MTIKENQEEIISEFKNCRNWFDTYSQLIKLGKNLPPCDQKYKTGEKILKGCQVQTWFSSEFKNGIIFYHIDSKSVIIKGNIALLLRVFSGQKPKDIKNADVYFIDKIGLRENFSPMRANSLWKVLNQIKLDAAACENSGTKMPKIIKKLLKI